MPWSTQTQSAKMAVIYITVGALIDVWTGVYYFLILRPQAAQNPENGSQTSFFWVLGFFLTGLSLLVIGLLVGRIGQAARKAEVAPPRLMTHRQGPDVVPAVNRGSIRVLLVDDHRMFRAGLVGLLAAQRDIEVVGEASDGIEAVALNNRLRPDIILMDSNMPRMGGIEATQIIVAETPTVAVIGLSMHHLDDMAAEFKAAGACEYLSKDQESSAVLAAIRSARRRHESSEMDKVQPL